MPASSLAPANSSLPQSIRPGRVSDCVTVWSLYPRMLVLRRLTSGVVRYWEAEVPPHQAALLGRVLEGTDVPTYSF